MPSACPRCRTPLPVPNPNECSHCGERLNGVIPLLQVVPASPPANPPPPQAGSGAFKAPGTLKGPRLSGRLADGKFGEFPLDKIKTTLGRHPANTLRLVDREVSKEHACIERIGTTFLLRDLNSSNGTFVNGRRVKELRLRDGDEIALGNSRLIFHSGDAAPTTSPGVTVVASAQSMPAFLAQIEHQEESEFRPVDQIHDLAALRQDYEKLRIANEFHRMVGLERDQKSLLDKILNVAFQLLPADNAVMFLINEESELNPVAVSRRKGGEDEVVVSDTVLKRVTESRQAVLTADAILDSRFSSSESIVAQGIRSAMAVPLLAKGVLKGLLFCDTRERTNAFSEKDLKILSGIASQAAIALENADLAQRIEKEAVTRAELSRFLSPAVAEAVVKGQVQLFRVGQQVEVSVLFADIRGFTSIAESEEAQDTVSMLNGFFTAMASVIFRHEGNLDKFIGDCVMAVWGPPSQHPDDPARALRAALEMQREVDALNQRRVEAGERPIQVGIGVNTGQAVVGYMGSKERHEFTAIGDCVNTASRLCSLAKGGEVIATETTVRKAGKGFKAEAMSVAQVKGKERGISTYKVVDLVG
ncbi:MAG: FHA domain-containing protein [Myxococcales bacterium]|nr:FHA domain-containing protein [Myxococcales bacterium]